MKNASIKKLFNVEKQSLLCIEQGHLDWIWFGGKKCDTLGEWKMFTPHYIQNRTIAMFCHMTKNASLVCLSKVPWSWYAMPAQTYYLPFTHTHIHTWHPPHNEHEPSQQNDMVAKQSYNFGSHYTASMSARKVKRELRT